MALFPQDALNDGVRKREVFGWAMYDFANSGYTTVVMTAVFNAYFVGAVAGGASWATLAWTSALAMSASRFCVSQVKPSPRACHSILSKCSAAFCSPVCHCPLIN